jgi:hypothetical protein
MKDPNLIVHGKIENGTLKIGENVQIKINVADDE